jgi:hypothetical protein
MYFTFSPSPTRSSYSTSPLDMPATSSSPPPQSPSCAYPSWPRRTSLSSPSGSSSSEERDAPTSYISDDDLYPAVFDDAEPDCSPAATPYDQRSPVAAPAVLQPQVVVDTGALMRELLAEEKARRKEKKRYSRHANSRKLRSGSLPRHMTPIREATVE